MIICKICSMCENMIICVEIWFSLDIYVKYVQCVKICSFVWKFYFHLIFVWKYVCFWGVCSFWSIMFSFWWTLYWIRQFINIWWRKRETCVSHLIKWRHVHFARISHMGKGRSALTKRVSLLPKRTIKQDIHQGMVLAPAGGIPVSFFLIGMQLPGARIIPWRTSWLRSSKYSDWRVCKS
jgi:hypothetical protein